MHAAVEWPSIERRLHFGALTDIRVDSDACVDDSFCLFLCQDTSPSPLSQLAFGPASTYEGWAADVNLTVPETCCFSWQGTSISNSHLDLLLISPRPIAQRREAYIYNSKNERFFSASIGQLHVNVGASKEALRTATAASARGRRRGFLSDRKYRYHPRTQADVANCWPWGQFPTLVQWYGTWGTRWWRVWLPHSRKHVRVPCHTLGRSMKQPVTEMLQRRQ